MNTPLHDDRAAKAMATPAIRPVILCGGSGARLWPLSRAQYPKQFMELGDDTLFARTVRRILPLAGRGRPLVVCNEKHRFFAAGLLAEMDVQADVLLEPAPRNTAPAIALAALAARADGEDPLLLVLPSDHAISPAETFLAAVETAARQAGDDMLVAFGIAPTRPEVGFGYIQSEAAADISLRRVVRFIEKPPLAEATRLQSLENCAWNSGIYLFRASAYLQELSVHAPEILAAVQRAWEANTRDLDFLRVGAEAFRAAPAVSIDCAVMEHTGKACMQPLNLDWNDLGSWNSFYDIGSKDAQGNVTVGDVVASETRNCYLHSAHRLVATLGVQDLAVVETSDAVLVMARDASQKVKDVLLSLQAQSRCEADTHIRVYRPWGSYEILINSARFQAKKIRVKEGARLSLQMHYHRAEHWIVVSGTAKVTVGDKELLLSEDESTYIPQGTVHRLENPGRIPLELIEVQTGAYLGEDDIVRIEDTYGRLPAEAASPRSAPIQP